MDLMHGRLCLTIFIKLQQFFRILSTRVPRDLEERHLDPLVNQFRHIV
jgi:hypothetical protein